MEKFDLYDKNRIRTGETMVRGETSAEEYLHIVVHICIIDSAGRMLIQKRCDSKKNWGGMWDLSAGGMAVEGEDSCAAAERETAEELGLKIDFSSARPAFTINFPLGFDDYYIINRDIELSEISPQKEEVSDVSFAGIDEIFSMIDSGTFVPFYKSLIKMIFDMRYTANSFAERK